MRDTRNGTSNKKSDGMRDGFLILRGPIYYSVVCYGSVH